MFSHFRCIDLENIRYLFLYDKYFNSFLRVDLLAALTCNVVYSEQQCDNLLFDVNYCRHIAALCPELEAKYAYFSRLVF